MSGILWQHSQFDQSPQTIHFASHEDITLGFAVQFLAKQAANHFLEVWVDRAGILLASLLQFG